MTRNRKTMKMHEKAGGSNVMDVGKGRKEESTENEN